MVLCVTKIPCISSHQLYKITLGNFISVLESPPKITKTKIGGSFLLTVGVFWLTVGPFLLLTVELLCL